jgi:hypothetical protein
MVQCKQVGCGPSGCVGADEHGEQLLAGPQLQRLQDGRRWQVNGLARIAKVSNELTKRGPRVEDILGCDQERRREEVLRCTDICSAALLLLQRVPIMSSAA